MMIELNDEQARVLADALESYLGDLSSEIHHTDSAQFRDGLKQRRELLGQVLDMLPKADA